MPVVKTEIFDKLIFKYVLRGVVRLRTMPSGAFAHRLEKPLLQSAMKIVPTWNFCKCAVEFRGNTMTNKLPDVINFQIAYLLVKKQSNYLKK